MQYSVAPYCPDYKLIEQTYETKTGSVELVYGEDADGNNQGLEAYYYSENIIEQLHYGHRYSRRWSLDKVPAKYQAALLQLRLWLPQCPVGHKLTLA